MIIETGVGTLLAYKAEAEYGVKPAALPPAQLIRRVSGLPTPTSNALVSAELRRDRQFATVRQGQLSLAATIAGELSMSSWDEWIEMAMMGTWTADTIEIGTVKRSMAMEAKFSDIARYQMSSGIRINSWAVSIQPNALITTTFGLMGQAGDVIADTEYFTTAIDPPVTPALTSMTGTLTIGGEPVALATGLDFTLNNTMTAPSVVFSRVVPDILAGRANLTGTITALFETESLVNAYMNETDTAIAIVLEDASSTPPSSFTFTFARTHFTGATIAAQGDTGAIVTIPFQALLDAASKTSFKIARVPGVYA